MNLKSPIALILLIMLFKTITAQKDTIEYYQIKDTSLNSKVTDYDKILKILKSNTVINPTNHLFKIDLIRLARTQYNFSFEHKPYDNFSLEHECIVDIIPNKLKDSTKYFNMPDDKSFIFIVLGSDLKYFYNFNRIFKKQREIINFSGLYSSLGLTAKIAIYNTDNYHIGEDGHLVFTDKSFLSHQNTMWSEGKLDNTQSIAYINFGTGVQYRIGKIGYWSIEGKLGVGSNKYFNTLYFASEFNFRVGFALSSFKVKNKKI